MELEHRLMVLQTVPEAVKVQKHNGKDHLVVPVIGLVEQVIQGVLSPFPELALASEFGDPAEAWNGRPVTLDHPRREGQFVSANLREVSEVETVGHIFDTQVEDDKLKMNLWLDLEKLPKAEAARIQSGEEIEVSTAYFAKIEPNVGQFKGKDFFGIERNIKPDHIALLPQGEIGACSFEDGCGGPRFNSAKLKEAVESGFRLFSKGGCECGGACSGSREAPGSPDSPSVNADKFVFGSFFRIDDDGKIVDVGEDIGDLEANSDQEYVVVEAAEDKVLSRHPKREEAEERAELLADSQGGQFVVARVAGVRDGNVTIYQRITGFWAESKIEVRQSKFKKALEAFSKSLGIKGETIMDRDEVIKNLISNGIVEEEDSESLKALSDSAFDKLASQLEADEEKEEEEEEIKDEADQKANKADDDEETEQKLNKADDEEGSKEPEAPRTFGEVLQSIDDPMFKAMLEEGYASAQAEHRKLVSALVGNERNKFTEDELKAMQLPELRKLVALTGEEADYSGQGIPTPDREANDRPQIPDQYIGAQAA